MREKIPNKKNRKKHNHSIYLERRVLCSGVGFATSISVHRWWPIRRPKRDRQPQLQRLSLASLLFLLYPPLPSSDVVVVAVRRAITLVELLLRRRRFRRVVFIDDHNVGHASPSAASRSLYSPCFVTTFGAAVSASGASCSPS